MARSELLDRIRERKGLPEPSECRRIRMAAGVSIRDVAREIGVSPMSVQRWETGFCRPGIAAAARYSQLIQEMGHIVGSAGP